MASGCRRLCCVNRAPADDDH